MSVQKYIYARLRQIMYRDLCKPYKSKIDQCTTLQCYIMYCRFLFQHYVPILYTFILKVTKRDS